METLLNSDRAETERDANRVAASEHRPQRRWQLPKIGRIGAKMRRRNLVRGGKVVLGLFVVTALLEVVLRLFGYGHYIIYRPDVRLLWVPISDQKGVTEDGHRPITINHEGFRYRVNLPPKAGNEIRIYTFGDSVTMGWGVDDDSTYSAVLERLLNSDPQQPARFRVISAGVNAYPSALALERLEEVLEDPSQVDIVIVAHSFNTEFGRLAELQGSERKEFLRRVAIKGIVRRSAIYNFFIEDLLRNVVYYRVRARLAEGSWSSRNEDPDSGVARYQRALWEMKRRADAGGVHPILLLLGSEGQKSELNDYQKTMLEFAKESGLPLVNMVDVFRGEDHSRIFLDHVHPNEYGHRVIAEQLAKVAAPISEEILRRRSGTSAEGAADHSNVGTVSGETNRKK